ncbi:MAG TPA: tetratricopeptide repeat protein, partial [Candidatus Edwardsbacteria bacterium]|nr:tetratricopeptide repeat protein [Candidatus Edwardsbacteria bacterium]
MRTTDRHAAGPWWLDGWRPALWLALWAVAVYARSLAGGFTYMDDYGLIVENIRFIGRIGNLFAAFRCDAFGLSTGSFYRPLLTVSLMFDAVWGGTRPLAYHLANVLIHAACCLLLFRMLVVLGHRRIAALIAAALFAAHPALAQAVAWIPGRNDTLLALWTLASFIALVHFNNGRGHRWGIASLLLWAAALFTKETALVFPAVAALFIVLWQEGRERIRQLFLLIPGWIVLAALFFWARTRVAGPPNGASAEPLFLNTMGENINGLAAYVYKAVLPVRLSVFAGYDRHNYLLGAAVLIILAALFAVWGIADKRRFVFGAGWFLVLLAPYAVRGTDYANYLEHRLYLPVIGLIILLLESPLVNRIKGKIAWSIAVVVLAVFGIGTLSRIPVFADGLTFWRAAADASPRLYNVHDMLGKVYMGQRDFAAARREFEAALELNPRYAFAHNNLGMVLLQDGQEQQARAEFRRALALKPDFTEARFNLGAQYLMAGQDDSAGAAFREVLRYDPGHAPSWNDLGLIAQKQGKLSQAEAHFGKAIGLDSANAVYQLNLGLLYLGNGGPERAIPALRQAVLLDPANARARRELGVIYLKQRRPDLAEPQLLAAW